MTPADQQKAWTATIGLMDKPIDQIQRYGASAVSEAQLSRIGRWMEEGFLQLLHLLPEEHFGPTRDKYALAIFEACANVRRKSRKFPRMTTLWMENAILLAYSPEVRDQLNAERRKMFRLGEKGQQLRDIPLRVWIIIAVGLLIAYWIGRRSH